MKKPQLLRKKANVNKRYTSKQSPEGKNINIRKMLQKLITFTGKTFMKNI